MAKGGTFENEVCRELSLWISEGKRDDLFMRSQSSGGRFTQRRKSGKDTAYQGGDITFSDPLGEPLIKNWNIEAKTGYAGKNKVKDADGNIIKLPIVASRGVQKGAIIGYKDKVELHRWDVLDFVDSKQKTPILQKMWDQCNRDATLTNREPILIFRRNGRLPCIMINSVYEFNLIGYFNGHIQTSITVDAGDICTIMNLRDFFEWIPNISIALNK